MLKAAAFIAALFFGAPALAQNVTCFTATPGDSTNKCASTAFVQGAATTTATPHVATNAALAASAISKYTTGVWRDNYSASVKSGPLFWFPQTGTCVANGMTNDGGSCVDTTAGDGNSWIAWVSPAGADIMQFGADATGVADSASAINAAMAKACAIHVPGGTFKHSGISTTCTAASILGNGPGISNLVYTGTGVAISINGSGVDATFPNTTVKDVSLLTNQLGSSGSTALVIRQYQGISTHRYTRKVQINNVMFAGESTYTQGWTNGLVTYDTQQVEFTGTTFAGQGGCPTCTAAQNTVSQKAVTIVDTCTGSAISVPDVYEFSGVQIYNWDTGIHSDLATGCNGLQGIATVNTNMVNVNYGMNLALTPAQPLVQVTSSHINAFVSAIKASGLQDLVLDNSLFYIDPKSPTAAPKLIDLVDVLYCSIAGNEFQSFTSIAGGTPGTAIYFHAGSGICTIDASNTFKSTSSSWNYGIYMESGSQTITIDRPIFNGVFVTATIFDGNSLATTTNSAATIGSLIYAASVSIPNNAGTLVNMNTVLYQHNSGFSQLGGAKIPSNSGYRTARVCVGASWAANATGERWLFIRKNGSATYPGQVSVRGPAQATALALDQNMCSGPLPVVEGDYFDLVAYQNSGGALALNNPWFSLEITR